MKCKRCGEVMFSLTREGAEALREIGHKCAEPKEPPELCPTCKEPTTDNKY